MDGFIAAISLNELVCVRQPTKFAGEPARLAGVAATSNFFRLLGTRMALGRNFLDEEDQPGRNRVALLSHAAWQQRLGGKPEVLAAASC